MRGAGMRGAGMRGLVFPLLALCSALAEDYAVTPRVTIVSPRDTEVLSSKEVTFEVLIEGVHVPQGGKALVIINEVLAFESLTERMSARATLQPGVHSVRAMLVPSDWQGSGDLTQTQGAGTMPKPPPAEEALSMSATNRFLVDVQEQGGVHVRTPWLPEEPGRVSVVIASHDRFEMVLEAIESVKKQTFDDWEIIVVNDASTDPRYYTLIEDVMIIHLPYNIGRPGLVRNIGISAASGEYIAFLDDDDVWLPHKLETQLDVMKTRNLNVSCSDAFAGNGSYSPENEYKRWLRDLHGPYAVKNAMDEIRHFGAEMDHTTAVEEGDCIHPDFCLPDELDWNVLIRANFVITSSVLVRRDTLFAAGPFNNSTLGEDHDLWKNLLRLSRCGFVRDPLVYWRIDSPDKLTRSWKT